MKYNVTMMDGDINIKFHPSAIQFIRDYSKFCDQRVCFGGKILLDDDCYIIEEVFLMKQESRYHEIKPDIKDWISIIDEYEKEQNVKCAIIGVGKNNELNVEDDLTSEEVKFAGKTIGSVYNQYFFIKANKKGKISVSMIDETRRLVFNNIPWDIDCRDFGESDSFVKDCLKKYVKSYSYSNNYESNYQSFYNRHTEPAVYKDAEINIKNPSFEDIV